MSDVNEALERSPSIQTGYLKPRPSSAAMKILYLYTRRFSLLNGFELFPRSFLFFLIVPLSIVSKYVSGRRIAKYTFVGQRVRKIIFRPGSWIPIVRRSVQEIPARMSNFGVSLVHPSQSFSARCL